MLITLNLKSQPFKTKVEINSIVSIIQDNSSGHNHIALQWEQIQEIDKAIQVYKRELFK